MLTCWCAWALCNYGNVKLSENVILWLLAVISFMVCAVGWIDKFTK